MQSAGGRPAIPLLVGTSGWQYSDWRGPFYPEGLPAARWLEYYAAAYPTVENNGTFYRLAAPKTFADWSARTPDGFVMAVKASRYLTHVRRLREPAQPVARLVESMSQLGDRLGPVLVQLPPNMRNDPSALDETLRQFAVQYAAAAQGGKLRVAVEFRHDSWFNEEIRRLLSQYDAALCWSDRRGRPLGPLWRTAGWGYLRLHEGAAQRWPGYGRQALRTWLSRISDNWAADADVFAYFNNDQHAAAPADAAALAAMAARAGWGAPQPARSVTLRASVRRPAGAAAGVTADRPAPGGRNRGPAGARRETPQAPQVE
jgi:uncharacterized protein YecE (DUF72 family)